MVESLAEKGQRQSAAPCELGQLLGLDLDREVVHPNPAPQLAVCTDRKPDPVIICIRCIKSLEERGT